MLAQSDVGSRKADVSALASAGGLKPREERVDVSVPARLCHDNFWTDIHIRDISSRGLKVLASSPLRRGTYVEIRWARHLIIIGRVVWARACLAGIETQETLDVPGIIAGIAEPQPGSAQRLDATHITFEPRRRSEAERFEGSRRTSAALQFGFVVALGTAAAALTGTAVAETLSRPLGAISATLEGG